MSNTTTITGNLTREPEIRYTKEGQATAVNADRKSQHLLTLSR